MKVLVTGANGFLGRHVVAELLRRGVAVRALVRPAADVGKLGWGDRVELFRADLRAAKNLPEAFEGVDALVHLAAAVTGGEDLQFAAGVVGTEKLLDAMAKSQTKRLVVASSFSVYDWSRIRGTLTEDSPLEREEDIYDRDGYAVAKWWQEKITRRAAEENGWQLTVMRPGFIWGRGNEYLAGIGQSFGPAHVVFGGFTLLPLTHVENCAHAFAEAALNPKAARQTFNVVDDAGVRVWRYAGEWLRRSGTRGFRVIVPYWAGMNAARVIQRVSKWIFRGKGKLPSLFVPCRFEARFKPLRFSNARLREVLGWAPPLSWDECLRRTYSTETPSGQGQAAPPAAKGQHGGGAVPGAAVPPRARSLELTHA